MSIFKVSIEKIGKIYPHSNADKLDLAQVESMTFQFCVKKDEYKVGDLVVYFPIDSVIPPNLSGYTGITPYLAGKDKNRIKTVRLRNEISQGIVFPLEYMSRYLSKYNPTFVEPLILGLDLTEAFGITKYDPPEVPCHAGNLVPHPDGVSTYDIEGADRFPTVLIKMLPQLVWISEKMEGQNHYSVIMPDNSIRVGQRNHQIIPIEGAEHDLWRIAKEANHFEVLPKIKERLRASQVCIRSEAVGPNIQDNIYKLKTKQLFTFDILADGQYLNPEDFLDICGWYNLQEVPTIAYEVILQDWLAGKSLQEMSNGQSLIGDTIREGLVFKPMVSQFSQELGGRLFIKQRDPIYLVKYGK